MLKNGEVTIRGKSLCSKDIKENEKFYNNINQKVCINIINEFNK